MHSNCRIIFAIVVLLISVSAKSQKLGIDIAAVRNHSLQLHGANASVFYHFTEKISAGVEVNRFFSFQKIKEEGTVFLSAWDFDMNLHYYLPVSKQIILYPLLGVSYSLEKEESETKTERQHFKYFNTGAGILLNTKTVKPHIEYVLASNRKTEQFMLAGITIELDLKK